MRLLNLFLASWTALAALSCTPASQPATPEQEQGQEHDPKPEQNEETSMKVTITAGGKAFTADIEDSETGKSFLQKLPMTLEMSELNGNEKYCYGVSLPRNDQQYDNIAACDLMLYSGNCVVLFYGPAGGYRYTRIGKLTDVTGLAAALGNGSVSVKFEKL